MQSKTIFQIFARSVMLPTLATNVISIWIPIWSRTVGPVPVFLAYLSAVGIRVHALFHIAAALEAITFRMLLELVWKRVPPINETFFNHFFFWWNFIMALLDTMVSFWYDESKYHMARCLQYFGYVIDGLDTINGHDHQNHERLFHSYKKGLLNLVLLGIIVYLVKMGYDFLSWIREKWRIHRGIGMVINNVVIIEGISLNNHARNEEVLTGKAQVLFTTLTLAFFLGAPKVLAKHLVQRDFHNNERSLLFMLDWNVACVVFPMFIIGKKKKMQKYIAESIFNCHN